MKLRINENENWEEDWVETEMYYIGYEEFNSESEYDEYDEYDSEIYADGAYFTILYNPSLDKYSWISTIEINAEHYFETAEAAYEDAVECLQPEDGSKLIVSEYPIS